MSISVRHNALLNIESVLASIVAGEDGYTLAYSDVTRLPINSYPMGKRAIAGVYVTQEQKTTTVGSLMNATLNGVIEIHVAKDAGEHIGDLLETALAEAERRLMEDQTRGGNCIDTNILGTDTNIDGTYANTGEASLFYELRYRHNRDNPADPYP